MLNSASTKLKYSKDYLLSFRALPQCKVIPPNMNLFPEITPVQDTDLHPENKSQNKQIKK